MLRWTASEDFILKEQWLIGGIHACIPLLTRRTPGAIKTRAHALGVSHGTYHAWKCPEDKIIQDNYASLGAEATTALLPGRTVDAVRNRASRLKVKVDRTLVEFSLTE